LLLYRHIFAAKIRRLIDWVVGIVIIWTLVIVFSIYMCLHMSAKSRILGQEHSREMPAKISIYHTKRWKYPDRLGHLCSTTSSVVEDKSLPLASTFADYALLFGTFVHGSPFSPPDMGSSSIFTGPFRLKADDNTSTCAKGFVKAK